MPFLKKSGIHVACIGNHDFDFGVQELTDFVDRCDFPWLLSNIIWKETGRPIADAKEFHILEHDGVKIGLIGIAEFDWIETMNTFELSDVIYEDFADCSIRLEK